MIDTIRKLATEHDGLNVLIAGLTCSGKTTLATRIQEQLSEFSVTIVHQDDYYRDLKDIPRTRDGYYLMDSPNAFCVGEFMRDMSNLLADGEVLVPRYCLTDNIRLAKDVLVSRRQVNVFEGLHVISLLRNLVGQSFGVFLATPPEICLARRIKRDAELYGVAETTVREYFEERMTPMAEAYIWPQLKLADTIIDGGG